MTVQREGTGVDRPMLPKQLTASSVAEASIHDDDVITDVLLENGNADGAQARDVRFERTLLRHFDLRDAKLTSPILRDVRFERCNLSQLDIAKAFVRRAEFLDCGITGLYACEGRYHDFLMRGCQGQYVSFAWSIFQHVRFERCILRDASFMGANLSDAVFLACDLSNVDMTGANLKGADIRGSTIDGLRVGFTEVQGLVVDLSQAAQLLRGLGADVRLA